MKSLILLVIGIDGIWEKLSKTQLNSWSIGVVEWWVGAKVLGETFRICSAAEEAKRDASITFGGRAELYSPNKAPLVVDFAEGDLRIQLTSDTRLHSPKP
jgi:hypothetical protein